MLRIGICKAYDLDEHITLIISSEFNKLRVLNLPVQACLISNFTSALLEGCPN